MSEETETAGRRSREDWDSRARAAGADGAVELPAADIVTAPWTRLKCFYGCPDYGRRLSCPPTTPPPAELAAAFSSYRRALLVWVEAGGATEEPAARRRLHEALLELERVAFLQGHPKALAMGVGPCLWCGDEPCPPDGSCRHRDKLRPSLSGCGIDVFQTAAAAGLPLDVAGDEQASVKLIGLLLIE